MSPKKTYSVASLLHQKINSAHLESTSIAIETLIRSCSPSVLLIRFYCYFWNFCPFLLFCIYNQPVHSIPSILISPFSFVSFPWHAPISNISNVSLVLFVVCDLFQLYSTIVDYRLMILHLHELHLSFWQSSKHLPIQPIFHLRHRPSFYAHIACSAFQVLRIREEVYRERRWYGHKEDTEYPRR